MPLVLLDPSKLTSDELFNLHDAGFEVWPDIVNRGFGNLFLMRSFITV